jgi:hypothetical protein
MIQIPELNTLVSFYFEVESPRNEKTLQILGRLGHYRHPRLQTHVYTVC